MRNFLSFLNIDFLVGKDSSKNWKLLLFISLLLMISIYSSHSADQKIFLIAKLKKDVNTLNSISVSTKVDLMNIKMESKVTSKLKSNGLKTSDYPPVKIIITD
tara:strand:- start:11309 stop:11617 length:309 start_codon:yes stop_codon:yes gene_type:complete